MPKGIHLLLLLNLLAAPTLQAEEENARALDAVEIFDCRFEESWDKNFDDWPDGWSRKKGPEYAHYVKMEIVDDKDLKEGRALQIRLDGANASISSPPIRILPRFSYTLNLRLKAEGLEHSEVTVALDFKTPSGEVVQTHRSEPVKQTNGWVRIELGKHRPMLESVDHAVAHVEVKRKHIGDLNGVVSITDVWLDRWPSMEVTTNSRFNVYNDPENVVVTCSLAGISEQNPTIQFQLLDATQTKLGVEGQKELKGRVIIQENRSSNDIMEGDSKHSEGFEGSTTWEPRIESHGFYRIRVRMLGEHTGAEMDKRIITLAVVPQAIKSSAGEFGWSLPESVPRLGKPLDFATLQELLPLAGLSWVKLPVWFPQEEQDRGDRIIQFAERLAATDIETIGIIQAPTQSDSTDEDSKEGLEIEYVFRPDPSNWLPLYDHVMNRLSLRLRWWQLGYDHDTSFVGHEDLVGKIRETRKNLYRFGQDIRLGLGWRWDASAIEGPKSWEFEQLSADPPLQSEQLDQHLQNRPRNDMPRWVLIEPRIDPEDPALELSGLSPEERLRQVHEARVREFIKQILVAKKHDADGIYIAHPFSGPDGVMNVDGTPGELLLPWRTAATLLGGAEYMGTLRLPNNSNNWLFRRPEKDPDKQVVMVVWNDVQTQEVLYLGENVKRIDVWGKPESPPKEGHRQVIEVGPEPAFVLGVNEAIAQIRKSVVFEQESIPSVFGTEHPNAISFRNEFPFGIGGTIATFVPDMMKGETHSPDNPSGEWKIYLDTDEIKSATGLEVKLPMSIELNQAAFGDQAIRIDFDLNDHAYKFSVWRSLRVGKGDIDIQASTHLDEKGRLIVKQRMVNLEGPPADFKCLLDAKGNRRKRTQVFQLGSEPDEKSYYYTNGKKLLGKDLKLEIQEIDGDRVLIYRFIAERESALQFGVEEEVGSDNRRAKN